MFNHEKETVQWVALDIENSLSIIGTADNFLEAKSNRHY
jgi:hypothetical protein